MTTVSIQQNVNGYTGIIDTQIRGSKPTTSYATATTLYVDGADSSNAPIQGLLYFSSIFGSGPGQIPLGATITSATLTLSISDATTSPVSLYRMVQGWTSLPTYTWNAFGSGIQTNGVEALSTADVTLSGLGTGLQSLNVTSSLQSWADGAVNNGWLLSSGGSNGWAFTSSEGGAGSPILTVTYELPGGSPPGLTIVESGGSTVVTEGGAGDSFTIALKSAPASDVTISFSTTGPGDLVIPLTSITFTAQDWAAAQTVSLSAIDDLLVEGAESYTVTMTTASSDAAYNGLISNVSVGVTDNDSGRPPLTPALVAVHDTTLYKAGDPSGYGCGDPSGIAYVPGLNHLFIVDSEHDESPYNSPVNLFITELDGTFVQAVSLRAFTKEPTGIGYNPLNGMLYITDDDARRMYVVDPNNPSVKVSEFDLRPFGITDAEDPKIDPATGHIFLLDGISRSLIELSAAGALVQKTVLPTAIKDAEALAFDPIADVFYIASGATRGTIFEVDRSGHILETIDLLNSYLHPVSGSKPKIKGLDLAPSSDPNDGDRMSLYAVDYGADQKADGRVFEIDLYHGWLGV